MTSSASSSSRPPPPPTTWPTRLQTWVGLGLITRAQADRILAAERGEPVAPPRRPASMLAEALGYVGGVLILVATAVLVGRFWAELGVTGRLVVTFGAVVLLIGVGAVVPAAGPAGGRLRAVLWLLAVAVLGFGTGLLADDVWRLGSETVLLVAACETAVVAAVLWWWHRTVLQQAAVVGALVVVAAAAAAHLPRDDGDAHRARDLGRRRGVAAAGLGRRGRAAGSRPTCSAASWSCVGTTFAVGPGWGSVLAIVAGAWRWSRPGSACATWRCWSWARSRCWSTSRW